MKIIIPRQSAILATCLSAKKSVVPPVPPDCASCYTYAKGRNILPR
jgi:hypothetical protein